MKILLILPAAARLRVTTQHAAVPKRKMLRFSLLPSTVAALTPRSTPWRWSTEHVEPLHLEADCDLVGITFMTALAPRAYELAAWFRQRGRIVVAGGYHPTLCPQDAARHFDAVVVGNAEGAWPQLLTDVQAGRLKPVYHSAPSSVIPKPRRDLLTRTARHYATINAIQAGQGCRHQCRYCSVTVFHAARYQHRPVDELLAEISSLPGDFMFVDDNIIADRAFAAKLFGALAPLGKRWVSQSSLAIGDDPELLRLAHAAGCCGLFVGVETSNQANLAAINKPFNQSARYRERLARIRHAGIGVVAGIIFGLDEDDPTVFARTLRFLEQLQVDAVQFNILTPLPGTPLHRDFAQAGRITTHDWSEYDFRHVVFRPARMTPQQLQAGADWAIAQFYRLDRIWRRFFRALFSVGLCPAFLGLKLGLTYRYDVKRDGIRGWNPARLQQRSVHLMSRWSEMLTRYHKRPALEPHC
ncbi:MAG: radical SAM protein [Verrucomicrobiota bacterium]